MYGAYSLPSCPDVFQNVRALQTVVRVCAPHCMVLNMRGHETFAAFTLL